MSENLAPGFRIKTLLGGTVEAEKFLAEGGQHSPTLNRSAGGEGRKCRACGKS